MKNKTVLSNAVFFAFLLSFVYWIYLALNSRMIIEWDALGYETLGRMLAEKGWREYFLTGPNREPLYPLLICLSIKIGEVLGISYQQIQVVLQFLLLFVTQLMLLYILRLLNINNLITVLVIFYFGISPAIVNSALSLYSEIITYPLVLAVVLIMRRFWVSSFGCGRQATLLAVAAGLLFALLVLSKGIFEIVTPVFVVTLLLVALLTHNRKLILNVLRHAALLLVVFYALVSGYKLANKVFSGNFILTSRGGIMFYGSAVRRTEPLSVERFLSALAYVPGENVCRDIFGEEKCHYWSSYKSDELAYGKLLPLKDSGMSYKEAEDEIIGIAFRKIARSPARFFLFSCIEGLKMFFWESSQMGFVVYPQGLAKLFSCPLFKNGVRFSVSLLTFVTFIYAVIFLSRRRREFFITQGEGGTFIFFSVLFVFIFGGFSSLCQILPRYALPVAPLYLVIIAFVLQKIFFKQESRSLAGN